MTTVVFNRMVKVEVARRGSVFSERGDSTVVIARDRWEGGNSAFRDQWVS